MQIADTFSIMIFYKKNVKVHLKLQIKINLISGREKYTFIYIRHVQFT